MLGRAAQVSSPASPTVGPQKGTCPHANASRASPLLHAKARTRGAPHGRGNGVCNAMRVQCVCNACAMRVQCNAQSPASAAVGFSTVSTFSPLLATSAQTRQHGGEVCRSARAAGSGGAVNTTAAAAAAAATAAATVAAAGSRQQPRSWQAWQQQRPEYWAGRRPRTHQRLAPAALGIRSSRGRGRGPSASLPLVLHETRHNLR